MGLDRELDGLLVVSVEQAVAAPYCGLLLADAGARVIKVERPEGDLARGYDKGADGQSVIFAWLNRGKASIALDLNQPDDAALLKEMVRRADVFLHNLAPGALERRGFSGPELRVGNPGLITCEITGYGRGPEAERMKAYDFLVQAESGLCAVTGAGDHAAGVGISVCATASGLTAYAAILRALIRRGRTGAGTDLSISMFDVIADWMNMPLVAHRYLGGAPARLGLTHALIAPYGAYAAKDGVLILIAVQSNREWQILCRQVLDRPDLATDPRFADNAGRVANRADMDVAIAHAFAQVDSAAMRVKLDGARIAWARLNEVADLSEHPFLRNAAVRFGNATIDVAALPVSDPGAPTAVVPGLNAHGAAIRREFAAGD